MFTSSGSTDDGHGGDAKTIISPNTLFDDIINKICIYYARCMQFLQHGYKFANDYLNGWVRRSWTFIAGLRTTFMHTHSRLNWVDEEEIGLKEKPEAPGVWAKDLIPNVNIIGTADSGKGRVVPGGPGRG